MKPKIYPDGSKYIGPIIDGTRNGKGKMNFPDGREYNGEFIDDEFNGQGTLIYPDGKKYSGGFKDNKRDGIGLMNYPDGREYYGEFKNDMANGLGFAKFANGSKYAGYIKEGKFDLSGIEANEDNIIFIGPYKDGHRHGLFRMIIAEGIEHNLIYREGAPQHYAPILTLPNGDEYFGEFTDGNFTGKATVTYCDGSRYYGEFEKGRRSGKGLLVLQNGDIYKGGFRNDVYEGWGVFKKKSTSKKYKGEYQDGKPQGKGEYWLPDNNTYVGNCKNGKFDGFGTIFDTEGNIVSTGYYKEGEPNGKFFKIDPISGDTSLQSYNNGRRDYSDFIGSDTNILFLDTETNGLPNKSYAVYENQGAYPRLVELAVILSDKDGKEIMRENHIVKPEGFEIPEDVAKIHGITQTRAVNEGISLVYVLKQLKVLIEEATYLVAHNMEFDENILGSEYTRLGLANPLQKKKRICTMKESTNFCAIEGSRGFKWPTLSELHEKIFDLGYWRAHTASSDVSALASCFWELKKMGIISIE